MMITVALVLAMGCGKEETPKPQEQAKIPLKPAVPDSEKGQPTPKKETPQSKTEPKVADQKPGPVLWEFVTGGIVISSPAIGFDGTVYVGSGDCEVYALKTDSKGPAKSPWPMRGQNPQHTGQVGGPATSFVFCAWADWCSLGPLFSHGRTQ